MKLITFGNNEDAVYAIHEPDGESVRKALELRGHGHINANHGYSPNIWDSVGAGQSIYMAFQSGRPLLAAREEEVLRRVEEALVFADPGHWRIEIKPVEKPE